MPWNDGRECGNCKWAYSVGVTNQAQCRLEPPIVQAKQGNQTPIVIWPIVTTNSKDWWCGRWNASQTIAPFGAT